MFVRSLAETLQNKLKGDKNGYKAAIYEIIIAVVLETSEVGLH